MPDSSVVPVQRVYVARQGKAKTKVDEEHSSPLPSISPAGPRKLVRPHLPVDTNRYRSRVSAMAPILTKQDRWDSATARGESSHAEAFYFQKQIQSHTLMTFVLEDGEQIDGTIEWYDRNSIKVQHGGVRTLIYKAGIKYLYKAVDTQRVNGQL
jgi:sRNA-binding regulator protein Hfq